MAPSNLKVYVDVKTNFRKDGVMIPVSLVWEDGTEYVIDRVTDIRPAAAAKAGGQGDRYTIRIGTRISYLFFERSPNLSGKVIGRWFVEGERHKWMRLRLAGTGTSKATNMKSFMWPDTPKP